VLTINQREGLSMDTMETQSGYTREVTSLWATSLTEEQHEKTCGYWYTVTSGAMAHTAFATRAGLDRWMWERGLTLDTDLPEQGEFGTSRINGTYRSCSHLDPAEFEMVRPVLATAELSNGDYTLGLVSEDDDGVRTVHYLNPNVKTRLVFDYRRTRETVS
jgi:hypothetical protein